ncbi:MAG: helix-turn-helix transcriptional regulator [Streptosporangiaceae bacterium]
MRADRLVAIVLLLQAHGQRTAGQLAEALETSERTIRRDLDALSYAGVPVYAQRGRGGGWALLGGHRIDLTGLTASEASSLVLAATGAPDQGDLDAALRKVLAALPEALRDQVAAARASVHVDRSAWGHRPHPPQSESDDSSSAARLEALRRALDAGVQVDLCYAKPGAPPSWRRVHPHGLVVKRGTWYLVASAPAGLRTYKVSRIEAIELSSEAVVMPGGFDLAATWKSLQRDFATLRPPAEVIVDLLVEERMWPPLSRRLGAWWDLVDLGIEADGRRHVRLSLPSPAHAAAELVSFADSLDVRSPPEVRARLAAIGQRLVDRYATSPVPSDDGQDPPFHATPSV